MLPEDDTSRMAELETLYVRHVDTVYRICYSFLKNQSDAEDAVQETFLKLLQILQQGESFADEAHEKAWLIVTASNLCKNHLRHWTRQKREDVEDWERLLGADPSQTERDDRILTALMQLPDAYRMVLYLYYYESYRTAEIAKMLKKKESTVRTLLRRGRMQLKKMLGGEQI